MKSSALRVLAAATLAGAVLTAATPAAQAQRVHFGVVIGGGPRYIAPPPPRFGYGAGFYGPRFEDRRFEDRRFFEERRREEFLRHEEWDRYHRYGARPYGYR